MSPSQSLPVTGTATAMDVGTRPGSWRKVSDIVSHVLSVIRQRARTATEHTRLSADTLRDIGLVRGEPPYVGPWDHCPMDYRL